MTSSLRSNPVLLSMLQQGEFSLPMVAAIIIVLFLSMGLHEYAHCLMATWWGDPTPRERGRLTPNPLVHIYWPGFIMFLVIGFGILGSAPVNPRRMRDPRWGSFWTSAAGPLSNLLIAIVSVLILRFVFDPLEGLLLFYRPSQIATVTDFISVFLVTSVFYNVLLFVFNLLPFFPLDGWHMVLALLPGRFLDRTQVPTTVRKNVRPLSEFLQTPAFKWQDWAQASQFVLMALIVLGLLAGRLSINFDPLGLLISRPTAEITRVLLGL